MVTNGDEWLISVMDDASSKVQRMQPVKRNIIRRVHPRLRNLVGASCFDPILFSIGPYHYGMPHLMPMEDVKKAAAKEFIDNSGHLAESFYNKVRDVTVEARECYDQLPDHLIDEEFINMMFFDGCFLLHLIDLKNRGRPWSELVQDLSEGAVWIHMFLMENQLPFVVLTALTSLKYVDIPYFFNTNNVPTLGNQRSDLQLGNIRAMVAGSAGNPPPLHMLDLLRMNLVGYQERKPVSKPYNDYCTRSATQHVKVGVQFSGIPGAYLGDIRFKSGKFMSGRLSLPITRPDIVTGFLLLNLIAFETSAGGLLGSVISSYVWLMAQLIQRSEDVEELRSSGVLVNVFGNNQAFVNIFQTISIATNLIYADLHIPASEEMEKYYSKKYRLYLTKVIKTHFSQWGTNPIAFSAATLALIFTGIQTIVAVWPSK